MKLLPNNLYLLPSNNEHISVYAICIFVLFFFSFYFRRMFRFTIVAIRIICTVNLMDPSHTHWILYGNFNGIYFRESTFCSFYALYSVTMLLCLTLNIHKLNKKEKNLDPTDFNVFVDAHFITKSIKFLSFIVWQRNK